MATVLQQTLVTVEEFEAMVFEFPTDLVQGEIVPMPPPGGVHGRVCMNVGFVLETWSRAANLGTVTANDSAVVTERDPQLAVLKMRQAIPNRKSFCPNRGYRS